MNINPLWAAFALMGLIGAIVNAVKWFIIDKDFSKESVIPILCWTGVFVVGVALALIFG